ncbi:hypothetical protein N8T08_009299 [Aspergillus melleus]|uniref:Uncharacterized protein n=1 Tax=Aspergillus melleus TaxID=138277 RepID=A0ACC3AUG4_9EURO|nr:hypothetical protein N8T08_009299 [Aspergillus melleus]
MSQHDETPNGKPRQDEQIEYAPAEATHGHHQNEKNQDKGLELIEDMGRSTILTAESNSRVLRKIDLRLLPLLLGIYFLQQLDKSTLSYASVFGLIEDANLKGQEYS